MRRFDLGQPRPSRCAWEGGSALLPLRRRRADPDGAARHDRSQPFSRCAGEGLVFAAQEKAGFRVVRSEEHTSELQSLMRISYAVFCLKKKKHENEKQCRSYIKNCLIATTLTKFKQTAYINMLKYTDLY